MRHRKNVDICVLAIVAFVLLMVSVVWVNLAYAEQPPEGSDARGMTLTNRQLMIEHAILTVITEGLPKFKIKPYLGNPLAKNRTLRIDLVLAIDTASTKYKVPPMLLVAMAYREGSFQMEGVGKLDEASTFQMVKRVANHIRRTIDPECSLDTYEGSSICAAAWLDAQREVCGDLHGAFVVYATGKRCAPSTAHVIWVLRDRFGIAKKLEEITGYAGISDSLALSSTSDNKGKS